MNDRPTVGNLRAQANTIAELSRQLKAAMEEIYFLRNRLTAKEQTVDSMLRSARARNAAADAKVAEVMRNARMTVAAEVEKLQYDLQRAREDAFRARNARAKLKCELIRVREGREYVRKTAKKV